MGGKLCWSDETPGPKARKSSSGGKQAIAQPRPSQVLQRNAHGLSQGAKGLAKGGGGPLYLVFDRCLLLVVVHFDLRVHVQHEERKQHLCAHSRRRSASSPVLGWDWEGLGADDCEHDDEDGVPVAAPAAARALARLLLAAVRPRGWCCSSPHPRLPCVPRPAHPRPCSAHAPSRSAPSTGWRGGAAARASP